jgi:hypothetical protein
MQQRSLPSTRAHISHNPRRSCTRLFVLAEAAPATTAIATASTNGANGSNAGYYKSSERRSSKQRDVRDQRPSFRTIQPRGSVAGVVLGGAEVDADGTSEVSGFCHQMCGIALTFCLLPSAYAVRQQVSNMALLGWKQGKQTVAQKVAGPKQADQLLQMQFSNTATQGWAPLLPASSQQVVVQDDSQPAAMPVPVAATAPCSIESSCWK